jgi:ABC-2 type transport system ATP-binding protein
MDAFESRYSQLRVQPGQLDAARALGPFHERDVFGQSVLMFDGADRDRLELLGDVRTPTLGDLFVAVMEGRARSQEVVR